MRVEHRMLSWRITRDAAVASLSCDSARLLYTWCIACADNMGRMEGEPRQVLADVGARTAWTVEQVTAWLGEMRDARLVDWYTVDGMRYIALRGWSKHQRMVGNMRARSACPPPPSHGVNVTEMTPVHTAVIQRMNGVHTEGEGEGEGESRTCVLSHTDSKAVGDATGVGAQRMRVNAARERAHHDTERAADKRAGLTRDAR